MCNMNQCVLSDHVTQYVHVYYDAISICCLTSMYYFAMTTHWLHNIHAFCCNDHAV